MPKQMHASIAVDLHADEFMEAKEKLDFKPLWDEFLNGLTRAGVKHTFKLETLETRAKPGPRPNGTTTRAPRRTAEQIAGEKEKAAVVTTPERESLV